MPEKDFLESSISITTNTAVNLDELYRILSNWFQGHKFDFLEKEYKEVKETGDLFIRWESKKNVTDYIVFSMETRLEGRNMKQVLINKKPMTKLDLTINVLAAIVRDYEDVWSGKPVRRFIREVYDNLVLGGQFKKMEADLTGEVQLLQQEIKRYLDLQKAA